MSQLFDYIVCRRPTIEEWADALESQDEDLQADIEARMPRHVPLKNLSPECFNILASCAQGGQVDVVQAVGAVDLVREISEEGPWVKAFRQPAIAAIAGVQIDQHFLERWAAGVFDFHGGDLERWRKVLSAEAAEKFKDLCAFALAENMSVYSCFYGWRGSGRYNSKGDSGYCQGANHEDEEDTQERRRAQAHAEVEAAPR